MDLELRPIAHPHEGKVAGYIGGEYRLLRPDQAENLRSSIDAALLELADQAKEPTE